MILEKETGSGEVKMQLDLFKIQGIKEFKITDEKHRLYIEALFTHYISGFYTDKNNISNEEDLINRIKKIFKITDEQIKINY